MPSLRDAVGRGGARHTRLQADRVIALFGVTARIIQRFLDIAVVGMAIDHAAIARGTTVQLEDGRLATLPLMSQSATSTVAMAVMGIGPGRRYVLL